MTYQGQSARRTNRVLIVLVVVTIAVVAFWAVNGGFQEIPVADQGTTAVN